MPQTDLLGRVIASVTSAFSASEEAAPPEHKVDEADAPHLDMTGDVLRQHLADAHYKDRALLTDAKGPTMQKAHIAAHNAAESKTDVVADEIVSLTERAIGADGMVRVKLISPGWGSSGYYSKEVLQRDGPRIWPKGTKMYADHPSVSEERDRPERSIKDIAAVFTETPVWEDDRKHGPGLYTKAKVVDTWKPQIDALIGNIDTSIRAGGKATQGEAEGRKGALIEELTKGYSVDFVTTGGRGGKVISLAESARERHEEGDMADETKLQEALAEAAKWKQQAERASTALIVLEARGRAATKLKDVKIPDATKERISDVAASNPPIKEGKLDEAAFDAKLIEAAKAEAAYLAKVTGAGAVRGMGGGEGNDAVDIKATEARLIAAFQADGMSEAEAKIATRGRN